MPSAVVQYPFAAGETIDRLRLLENIRELERAANGITADAFSAGTLTQTLFRQDAGVFPVHVRLTHGEIVSGGVIQGYGIGIAGNHVFPAGHALLTEWTMIAATLSVESIDAATGCQARAQVNGVDQAATLVEYLSGQLITEPAETIAIELPIAAGARIDVRFNQLGVGSVRGAQYTMWFRAQQQA